MLPRRRCAAPLRGDKYLPQGVPCGAKRCCLAAAARLHCEGTSISPKGSPVGQKDVASLPLRGSTARDKYLPQGVPCGKRCCLAAAARLHCEGTSISPKGSPVGQK